MQAKRSKRMSLFLGMIAIAVLCAGCGKKEKEIDASVALEAIGYDYEKTLASPQYEVLFQNADKTTIYHVTYHPDTTAKEAAEAFEAGAGALTKEETTWEKNMWEYSRFGYENHYSRLLENETYFGSVDWDLELWKYVVEEESKKSVTETLFFDRADGCYSLTMTYSAEDVIAKMVVYHLASEQDFQVDIDRSDKMQEGLSFVDEINENGELVITVTNNGEETVETVSCMVNISGTTDRGVSRQEENVAPGQTETFVIEQEHMEGAEDYEVDIYAFFALRAIDSEGEVWNVH